MLELRHAYDDSHHERIQAYIHMSYVYHYCMYIHMHMGFHMIFTKQNS